MPNTSNISSPIKGLQTDLAQLNTDSSTYSFALNAVTEGLWQGNSNFLSNELSNICNVQFPDDYQVVGFAKIHEQNRVLYILTNPKTGHSQIGEVINIKYKDRTDHISNVSCDVCDSTGHEITPLEKQKQQCYNLYQIIAPFYDTTGVDCSGINVNYPIDIEYKITNCSLNIYFTDALNERRFMYFDYENNDLTQPLVLQDRFKKLDPDEPYIGTDECPIPQYINEIDCDKIKVHPNLEQPCVEFIDFVNGGNLKAGTYQILIAYSDQYGNPISHYFPGSPTIPLWEKQIAFETNYETSKALSFKIYNLKTDSIFQFYNIVIAQTIEQFTEFIHVGTFSTVQNTYTYTGFERTLKKLAPTEVFFRRPYYKTARGVTTANNYLFYNGVKEYPLLNLQPVANKIKLQWQTIAIKESDYRNPRNTFFYKTYQRDEVYPFAIVFEFDNGRETCAFHIPGREKTESDAEIIDIENKDVLSGTTCDDLLNCIDGLTITVQYAPPDSNPSNPCNSFPDAFHQCNRAAFFVQANGYRLENIDNSDFVANLNNNGGELFCDNIYPDTIPGDIAGARTSTITVTQNQIRDIAVASIDGGITIALECATPSCGCHTNAAWIRITNSLGQVLHDGCATEFTFYPCRIKEKWQVYNTGTLLGGDYEYSETCNDDKCWEYGEFAYWQSTETYPQIPEVWGDLCGMPIRHHKFPDSLITHIHDGKNIVKDFNYNNYIYPIGVQIDHQSIIDALDEAVESNIITEEDKSHIVAYRIVRGNRVGNKSIQAKGLLFNMLKYNKYNQDYYFPNYSYNDLRMNSNGHDDMFLQNVYLDAVDNESQRFTFHSPDTHFVNTSLGNILKIETEEHGKTDGYFTHSDCQAKHKFLNTVAHVLALGLGIAAAYSATGEKQCRVITYQAPTITTGEDGYGNVSGSWTAILTPLGGSHTGTISTSGAKIDTTDTTTYDNATGTNQGTNPTTGQPVTIPDYSKEEITYCTGQPFQIFNSDSYIGGLITGIFASSTSLVQRTILGIVEMNKVLDTLRELIPYKNYSIQYNSAGKYNTYIDILNNGNKQRRIDVGSYLNPIIQSINEPLVGSIPGANFNTIRVNNWNRESSVYLKTSETIANPTLNYDTSKIDMRSAFSENSIDKLNINFSTDIASFYVSVKRDILNQYGQLCNIEYLETNSCQFRLTNEYTNCKLTVFGGDTFISRFALKRKMPFFLHTMCNLPDGSDILYKELSNVGEVKYYFNTKQPLLEKIATIGALPAIGFALTTDNLHNYDVHKNRLFYQDGYIHLFNYGIPYFLVESDINVNYRHGQNNTDKDFYPHNTDLKRWFEEEYVPISTDNYYFYNRTYSKQNKESVICTSCILDKKDLYCQTENYNRLIYSEPTDTENKNDNWLIFKANSFYDFPLTLGKLITADGIENDKVLVRLEKGTQIFSAYNTIQATGENIQVGTGGMFQTRPKDIATTNLGYAGSQHRDILHTEYGHIWADAQRGQVFNLGTGASGIDEISKDGMKSWFKENLPFRLKEDFPTIPNSYLDNNLNGVGLHYCFDKRFNRILITKLDYKVIDKNVNFQNDIEHENFGKFYVLENETIKIIELTNPKYFCNKSWTISYNFYNKAWTSFHSYTPNFYIDNIDTFDSSNTSLTTKSIGEGGIELVKVQKTYTHNVTNKSYQVFYGKLYPFIIEFQSQQSLANNYINSVQFDLDVIRYHNEFDTFYIQNKTFNKAIIYNNTQTSGLLHLKISNPEDLTEIEYPKRITDGYEILITNSENNWGFNDFWDVTRNQFTNIPIFNYDCNNVNKTLNSKALNYDKSDFDRAGIRNKMCKIRLINDIESNYSFIFNFGQINSRQSFR